MLKTLRQIARTGIVTEPPPPADEALRVREALEARIRDVLGRALCIRQVDAEVLEAADAFGASHWQRLFGVQLPLALPSIMAGINQTVMMALSMVVIASMIGARGLGEEVLIGIQTLNVGKGLEAGLAIVILAVAIDRITQAYGRPERGQGQ